VFRFAPDFDDGNAEPEVITRDNTGFLSILVLSHL
jgi:hypothetical protein